MKYLKIFIRDDFKIYQQSRDLFLFNEIIYNCQEEHKLASVLLNRILHLVENSNIDVFDISKINEEMDLNSKELNAINLVLTDLLSSHYNYIKPRLEEYKIPSNILRISEEIKKFDTSMVNLHNILYKDIKGNKEQMLHILIKAICTGEQIAALINHDIYNFEILAGELSNAAIKPLLC